MIDIKEFPRMDEMIGLTEVVKDIQNDIQSLKFSGTYIPKRAKELELELKAVQNILAEFYN